MNKVYYVDILEQNRRIDCKTCDITGKETIKEEITRWYMIGFVTKVKTKTCSTCGGKKFTYREGRETLFDFLPPEK